MFLPSPRREKRPFVCDKCPIAESGENSDALRHLSFEVYSNIKFHGATLMECTQGKRLYREYLNKHAADLRDWYKSSRTLFRTGPLSVFQGFYSGRSSTKCFFVTLFEKSSGFVSR